MKEQNGVARLLNWSSPMASHCASLTAEAQAALTRLVGRTLSPRSLLAQPFMPRRSLIIIVTFAINRPPDTRSRLYATPNHTSIPAWVEAIQLPAHLAPKSCHSHICPRAQNSMATRVLARCRPLCIMPGEFLWLLAVPSLCAIAKRANYANASHSCCLYRQETSLMR